jgi:hypothetical protein
VYKELRKGNRRRKFAPGAGANGARFEGETTQADEGNRTPNLLITNQLLCQLSYVSLTGTKRQTSRPNIKCRKKPDQRGHGRSCTEFDWNSTHVIIGSNPSNSLSARQRHSRQR